MDPEELKKLIKKTAGDRTALIDRLLAALEQKVATVQKSLLQAFVMDWVNKLEVDSDTGRIKNTLANKRLLNNVDTLFAKYVKTDGVVMAKAMIDGVSQILDFNGRYFKQFNTHAELIPLKAQAKEVIQSWLGMKGNGWLQGNGYLAKTINDPRILGELKNVALRAVVSQQGYQATLSAVQDFINGNKEKAGLLQRYHRNFVYDTYSVVDRVTAGIYATKLGLNYAIYEGGLIKTSRIFCRDHNGNVYSRSEIEQFAPKEAVSDNYDPLIDMGGYGCRHHYNWVPEAVAVLMRPDLAGA